MRRASCSWPGYRVPSKSRAPRAPGVTNCTHEACIGGRLCLWRPTCSTPTSMRFVPDDRQLFSCGPSRNDAIPGSFITSG